MWYYKGEEFTSEDIGDYIGMVYCITDLSNGMKYIGKKGLMSVRRLPPLKGQKRKRKKIVETDWKKYYGSSEQVKLLVEEKGPENFKREILYLCTMKGEMTYLEAKEQFARDVLLKPDEYYNKFIGCKLHAKHVAILMNKVVDIN
jgi:hypothetical protein|tara:strand:- start:7459 stop:7893 length:435 start_codon:yes stop_codon:yes gene_type:complete